MSAMVTLPPDLAVLMYHYVRPADPPMRVGAGSVDLDTFAAQLDDLQRHAAVVSWAQVAAAMAGGGALPPDAVLLTFDDGEDDHHRYVLPMLAERGLPGTFFVMARDPADGLTVAHRIHVVLAWLSPRELREALIDRLSPDDRARIHGRGGGAGPPSLQRSRGRPQVGPPARSRERRVAHPVAPR